MPDERTDSISSQEFVNEAVLMEVREEPGKTFIYREDRRQLNCIPVFPDRDFPVRLNVLPGFFVCKKKSKEKSKKSISCLSCNRAKDILIRSAVSFVGRHCSLV